MLDNGNVATQNGAVVGSKAIYACNSNYVFTVNSSMERICQSFGNWSDEIIECGKDGKNLSLCLPLFLIPIFLTLSEVDCGPAPMLVNGNITTHNGTLVGSKAIYNCNSNYKFTSDSSMERTCESSGDWSDEIIECGEDERKN